MSKKVFGVKTEGVGRAREKKREKKSANQKQSKIPAKYILILNFSRR